LVTVPAWLCRSAGQEGQNIAAHHALKHSIVADDAVEPNLERVRVTVGIIRAKKRPVR